MSDPNPPLDIEAAWDLDGMTATMPGVRLSLGEVVTVTLGFMLGMSGLVTGLLALASLPDLGAFVAELPWLIPWLPLGMLAFAIPAMGIAYVRGRRSTVEVRIEPGARSSYSWLKGDVQQRFRTRAIRSVVVPDDGLPRLELTLDPERAEVQGTAHQRRGKMVLRFQTRAHARWVADRFDEALEHRSECEGEAASVPRALTQLQAARRQDEG